MAVKKPRVLVVCPRFAPVNAADSHRVRLLLPHAAASGWDAEVLAVEADDVPGPKDDWLLQQLPPSVPVHRVHSSKWIAAFCNGLALRTLLPLHAAGDALLATGRFDLVFFSTTDFLLTLLGPLWRQKHGIPFCMDYQDPWVNDYYVRNPSAPRPGGVFKFALMQLLDQWAERRVVAACSGFLSVSASYITALQQRYGAAVSGKPVLVSGFPGEPAEFAAPPMAEGQVGGVADSMVWRYIGRGGADLSKAASAFFQAWQLASEAGVMGAESLRFEALGTSYAEPGRAVPTIAPLAAGTQLQQLVTEQTGRLAYSTALQKLVQSDALVVFGSDDPAYTASKLYSCLLARRPLLVILHRQSPAVAFLQAAGGAVCVTFESDTLVTELAQAIYRQWFAGSQYRKQLPLDCAAFEPFTAAAQARSVNAWFASMLAKASSATEGQ